MNKKDVRRRLLVVGLMIGLVAAGVRAGVIVPGLDDSTAIADYSAARNGVDQELPDVTGGKMTLAARFNPDVSQATAGPVIVIENGGTSNGTGIYLAGGSLVFCAKADNGRYSVPTGMQDTDFSNDGTGKAMAVTLGPVTFGTENTVYVSMDLIRQELFASVNGATCAYVITGAGGSENIDGNRSATFLGVGPITAGHMGGLLEEGGGNNASTLYPQLFWTNAVPMIQSAGYSNQRGQVFAAAYSEHVPYVVLVTESNGTSVKEGGAADTLTVMLTADPSGTVEVRIEETCQPAQLVAAPSVLLFNSENWQVPQTVTVAAVDDTLMEKKQHESTLTFSVIAEPGSPYEGFVPGPVTVQILENDCGVWGYSGADMNQDCQVNIEDLSLFALQWLDMQ